MTKAATMNCAAILAAGIMANQCKQTVYNVELAVDLMEQIAAEIDQRESESQNEDTPEWVY